MKAETSMNLMLVVFCIMLFGFVLLNNRYIAAMSKKQADSTTVVIP